MSVLVEEVSVLKQKVKWYAENQLMLDKDIEIIKVKDDQIKILENRISSLQVTAC